MALASRQCRRRLSELYVAQSHVLQGLYLLHDVGHSLEELYGLVYRHVQNVGYRLAFVAHFQCLAVVALAVAGFAWHHYVGQEVHLDGLVAVSSAHLTPSAFHVEREAPRLVAAYLGFRKVHKKAPYVGKHAGVGGWIGTRSAPDGALIHVYNLVNILQSLHTVILHGLAQRAIEVVRQYWLQCLVDESRLSRAADTRHYGERSQRESGINVLQVVARRAPDNELVTVAGASLVG